MTNVDVVDRDLFGEPVRFNPVAADRDQFIEWMTDRFRARTHLTRDAAHMHAEACMGEIGAPFGDAGFDWSHDAAHEIVDGELEYWEAE